jgi:hypothetical protein
MKFKMRNPNWDPEDTNCNIEIDNMYRTSDANTIELYVHVCYV